jgi:drug/metabolite transporter (DMT)-like permease
MTVLYLIYLGLAQTSSLQAAFILNTKPIFIVLAGVLILKEVEEKNELLGLILSVIGITLVIVSPIIFSLEQAVPDKSSVWGICLIVLAVLIDTFRTLGVKKYYQGLNQFMVVAISSLIGLLYFGFLGYQNQTIPSISTYSIPSVATAAIYMGTLGTILAFAFQFMAYTRIEASEATLFEYLQPLVYIPLAVLWLGEALLPTQLVGVVAIGFGVYLAGKRHRKNRSPAT